jgi:hypothetical protein
MPSPSHPYRDRGIEMQGRIAHEMMEQGGGVKSPGLVGGVAQTGPAPSQGRAAGH